jgi:predicted RNase H-like HicB family nuclease
MTKFVPCSTLPPEQLLSEIMASYIALLRKDKNSDYGVEFPDLPGCISAGTTLEEARRMAEEALAAHAAFLRENGDEVPAPSPLDVIARRPEIKGAVPLMVELKYHFPSPRSSPH